MPNKHSMVDIAFEALSKGKEPMTFSKLWEQVVSELGFNESKAEKKISTFYTDMMLDSRFASLEDNKWDLRIRRKYDEVHKGIAADDDDDTDDDDIVLEDDDIAYVEDSEKEKTRKEL